MKAVRCSSQHNFYSHKSPLIFLSVVTLQSGARTVECSVIEKFYQSQVQSESDKPKGGAFSKSYAAENSQIYKGIVRWQCGTGMKSKLQLWRQTISISWHIILWLLFRLWMEQVTKCGNEYAYEWFFGEVNRVSCVIMHSKSWTLIIHTYICIIKPAKKH